jgi:hypothetical protein
MTTKYLTEGEKKLIAQHKDPKEKTPLQRIMMGGAGLSVASAATPLVAKSLSPTPTVYHGTSPTSANLIFNQPVEGQRGLFTRFAGSAHRVNSIMLPEGTLRILEAHGVPLSLQELDEFSTKARKALHESAEENLRWARATDPSIPSEDRPPKRSHKPPKPYNAPKLIEEHTRALLATKGLAGRENERLLESVLKNMKESGQRIYYGWHPSTVATWGEPGSELEKAKQRAARRTPLQKNLRSLGNLVTFGLYPEMESLYEVGKYRPDKITKVTLEEAAKRMQNLPENASIVIGHKVPGGASKWMTDFPGLSTLMTAQPGLKASIREYQPAFDPSRDMSTHRDVPIEHFRSVDIIDGDTRKIERLKITGGAKPKFRLGRYLKGFGRTLPQAAVGLLGLDILQSAIRKDETFLRKFLHRGSNKTASVSCTQELEKIAFLSPAGRLAAQVAAVTVPMTAMAALTGILVQRGVAKKMPMSKVEGMSKTKATAYEVARGTAMAIPAALIGGAVSAAIPAVPLVMHGKPVQAAGAGYLGLEVGSQTAADAAMNRDMVSRGMPATVLSPLNAPLEHPRAEKIVEKYPEVALAIPLAAGAAIFPGIAYALRKYYPGMAAKGLLQLARTR